jgi:hypothetical protein
MNKFQAQYEKAVGESFIEWLNAKNGDSYRFKVEIEVAH